jgi:hypothetical protein
MTGARPSPKTRSKTLIFWLRAVLLEVGIYSRTTNALRYANFSSLALNEKSKHFEAP